MLSLKNYYKQPKKFLIIPIVLIIVLLLSLVLIKNNRQSSQLIHYSKSRITTLNKSSDSTPEQIGSLPNVPISCSSHLSLVPLSGDFTINAMSCVPSGSTNQKQVLECNGTIFSYQVSINCYPPNNYSPSAQLACIGPLNSSSPSSTIPFSYNCTQLNVSNNIYYSCSGSILNYSPTAINFNLSSSCLK